MADIINSRGNDQQKLMEDFKKTVKQVNLEAKELLLSPMTITLGDEFQSVARDLQAALSIIISLEEKIAGLGKNFQLRYVLLKGKIDTPVNTKIAYEMLGSGLTEARENLLSLKNQRSRFKIILENKSLQEAINHAFIALQDIIDGWNSQRDHELIRLFLQLIDYKKVAANLEKERSLIWKRRKSLRLDAYFSIKDVIFYLGGKRNV